MQLESSSLEFHYMHTKENINGSRPNRSMQLQKSSTVILWEAANKKSYFLSGPA